MLSSVVCTNKILFDAQKEIVCRQNRCRSSSRKIAILLTSASTSSGRASKEKILLFSRRSSVDRRQHEDCLRSLQRIIVGRHPDLSSCVMIVSLSESFIPEVLGKK